MSFKMRAPSVPLINVDPYFNIWSNADHLNDKNTVHWTGSSHALTGVVTVDGTDYCFMGSVRNMAKLPQTDLDISALSTVYTFANESIVLTARFTTPLLPDDLVLASRPIAYLQVTVASADGAHHIAKVSITADDELCLNKKGDCHTKTLPLNVDGLCGMGVTATEQKVLTRSGDNLRIEWGTFWLATSNPASAVTVDRRAAQTGAVAHTLCVKVNLDTTNNPSALYLLGYDDEYSMVYFGTQLRSLWNADGKKLTCLLKQAADEYPAVLARCEAFSQKLYADALAAGGEKYAELCSLAYRQTFGAHKLCTAPDGEVLFISKECFSNGCAATVDVSYPSIPLYLLYNPELVKGMYRPILHYASSPAWPFDFAPHDAGQYPLVNGQVYGDNQLKYQMPVEECGNMLVSLAAVCIAEKSTDFVAPHMGLLQTWCDYLLNNGLDPANQLCTDDFAGHLAHNCNLSVKAVMGITAFSIIKRMMNETAEADRLLAAAREMAAKWAEMAANGDGSYRLAFDAADSFSMKYNMVWDLLFGTDIFPKEIFATETASYYKHINAYGMPLDNRETYTKSDWLVWSATLCDDPAYFKAMVEPLWEAYNTSESRVPLTDWYDTVTALQICWDDSVSSGKIGFQNRTVQGGLFIKMLSDSGKMKIN